MLQTDASQLHRQVCSMQSYRCHPRSEHDTVLHRGEPHLLCGHADGARLQFGRVSGRPRARVNASFVVAAIKALPCRKLELCAWANVLKRLQFPAYSAQPARAHMYCSSSLLCLSQWPCIIFARSDFPASGSSSNTAAWMKSMRMVLLQT